jgi:hypothetical protein
MDENDIASHKKALSDEVLRNIGRNVLLFQQIEAMLKFLLANHCVNGTTADIVERKKQRSEQVQKQTMGTLVGQYSDDILSDAGEPTHEPEDVTQAWMSFTFTITGDIDFYESVRADMQQMVDERNKLIHHFLPRWQPDSVEHLTSAALYLEQQREKVLPILEHLKSVTESMQKTHRMMASDEIACQFELLFLQHSPLVALLLDIASQKGRTDGWTYLAHAGRLAHIHESDAVMHMKERYGHSTLKRLLIASELFDVRDEPLPNGGFRTIYREKKILRH